MPITPRQAIPRDWTRLLTGGRIGIGHDVATTEKKTSNPSGITVMEHAQGRYIERLVLIYKTGNEEVAMRMIQTVLDDIKDAKLKARRFCVDASSEVFYAQRVKKRFVAYCPIALVKGGESIQRGAEVFSAKVLLGNLYSGLFEDGLILTPSTKWYKDDIRRVHREKGSFVTELGENGEHGECFDAGKLAYWALEHGSGRAEAAAVPISGYGAPGAERSGILGSLAALFEPRSDVNINL
jgi:hypothetical protein